MGNPRKRAPLDAAGLWEFALKSLGARACSSGELRQKLRARAERAEDVDATLARLKEYRYLDDRRFAESFAIARWKINGLVNIAWSATYFAGALPPHSPSPLPAKTSNGSMR